MTSYKNSRVLAGVEVQAFEAEIYGVLGSWWIVEDHQYTLSNGIFRVLGDQSSRGYDDFDSWEDDAPRGAVNAWMIIEVTTNNPQEKFYFRKDGTTSSYGTTSWCGLFRQAFPKTKDVFTWVTA